MREEFDKEQDTRHQRSELFQVAVGCVRYVKVVYELAH